MDQFILFGDSITQQSFSQEDDRGFLGPALTDYYIRRLDIVNRGFSGYNTRQALRVLPKFTPSPLQARVRFLMIWFGANDARLPNTPGGPDQHVPLDEYKDNLRKIATHPCVKAHEGIRIILVTPPPVDERKLIEADGVKYPDLGSVLRRTANVTATYAQAVRDLAGELHLPVLDISTAMTGVAGEHSDGTYANRLVGSREAPQNSKLQEFLHDGLHFSRSAYELLVDELIALIGKTWPDQTLERLPFVYPAWDDGEAWEAGKTIEARTRL